MERKYHLATRQAKSLQNLLIRARFDVVPKPIATNFGSCNCRVFCIATIILNLAKNLNLKLKSGRYHIWRYNHYFDYKSRDVIYFIIFINCEGTYIRETECLREHMNNTKSSIRHANALSLPYTQHISSKFTILLRK